MRHFTSRSAFFPTFVAILSLALPACVNPYRANFNSTRDKQPSWVAARLGPPEMKPQLVKTQDIHADGWRLFEKGYVMIGFTKFDAPQLDSALAVDEAKKEGADIVLVQDKFTHSLTENVAVTQWGPDETTEVQTSGQISGNGAPREYQQTTETRTSQGPETVYVPEQTDYYEHSATFWRKLEGTIFGAFVADLSDALKQSLQSNQGLLVKAVMTDSPAFKADLLKGDIIRTIDGQPVPGAARFLEDLATEAGKEIKLTILRGSQTLERSVKLNP